METQLHRPPARHDDGDGIERRVIRPDVQHEVEIDTSGDQPEITVPISSTTPHRSHGKMTEQALESMREQLKSETVGLWDDHGIDEMGFPEYRRQDMYGWWVDGHLEDGTLFATARLRDGDTRTADLIDQLDQGMPIGFSVGYIALDDEMVDNSEGEQGTGEQRHILDVDLLETSPVGIPDNPDAVAEALATDYTTRLREVLQTNMSSTQTTTTDEQDEQHEAAAGDTDTDTDDTDAEQEANTTTRQFGEEDIEEILEVVAEVHEAHMGPMLEDITEMLLDDEAEYEDEDEESAEGGGDEDEEEEGMEGSEGDKDEEEEKSSATDEIREELATLREEKEEMQAKVQRLEGESRESRGRKGRGMTPAATDDDVEEATSNTSTAQTTDRRPRNAVDEAFALED